MAIIGPKTRSYTNATSARYNFNRLDPEEFNTDPFFANNILLLSTTSTTGAQNNTFLDSSTNNLTITRNGNSTQGTFNPYNSPGISGSAYFDGTGDYLNFSALSLNADFTVETWIYPTAYPVTYHQILNSGSTNFQLLITGGFLNLWNVLSHQTSIPLNTWTHIACVRSGTSVNLYVNGVRSTSTLTSSTTYTPAYVGTYTGAAEYFSGYMSNFRIVKGTAVYTGNFTPPVLPVSTSGSTTPYTNTSNVNTTFASANTNLLLNFTNAGITDATGLNVIETVNQTNVNTVNAKYSRAVAFDGTDDSLVMPYNSAFNLGSAPFTIEAWVLFRAFASNRLIFETYTSAATDGGYQFYYRTTGTSIVIYGNGVVIAQSSFTGHQANTWYHVAATRDTSNNVRVFVDGTQYANVVYASNLNITASARPAVGIQYVTGTNDLDGLVEDLRVTKGVARYTGNFTPPTRSLPRR